MPPKESTHRKVNCYPFIHGLSGLEKQCDFSPPFLRAASKHLFLLSALNPWKNKSHLCRVTRRSTGITREVHSVWQQKSSAVQRKRRCHQREGQAHRSSYLRCAMMLDIILTIQRSLLLREDCSSPCSGLGLPPNQPS